jgi:hypothetical protein
LAQLFNEANKCITARSGCRDFLQTAVRLERYKCFEVALDHIVCHLGSEATSGWPRGILTLIVENIVDGLRYVRDVDSFPFYSLVFKAIAEKRLYANPYSVGCHWSWMESPFLESPRAVELMASAAESPILRRMLRVMLKPLSFVNLREALPILERMVDAGIQLLFDTVARVISIAQSETLVKFVFRATVIDLKKYPRWFSKTILFPVCVDRDWQKLRREVEDFAEDFDQKVIGECYMSLMESVARARDVVGDDGGVEAANGIIAAFTPWLFGGE